MQGRARAWADAILFSIGAAGAAWEIFWDHSQNYFVYALIFALLRLGAGILDKAQLLFGSNQNTNGKK
jgi:hypothetical protein